MTRVERFHAGTKISDWASGSITANAGSIPTGAGYYGGGDAVLHASNQPQKATLNPPRQEIAIKPRQTNRDNKQTTTTPIQHNTAHRNITKQTQQGFAG
jgi:hypothetical protein